MTTKLKILTLRTYLAASRYMPRDFELEPREELDGYATRLSLTEAIKHLRAHQSARNNAWKTQDWSFTVVSVSEIEDDYNEPPDARTHLVPALVMIEDLPTDPDQFETD